MQPRIQVKLRWLPLWAIVMLKSLKFFSTKVLILKENLARDFTIPMIDAVECLKKEVKPDKKDEIHYDLDTGYASEQNYEFLKDRDLYMPDQGLVAEQRGRGQKTYTQEEYLTREQYPTHMNFTQSSQRGELCLVSVILM